MEFAFGHIFESFGLRLVHVPGIPVAWRCSYIYVRMSSFDYVLGSKIYFKLLHNLCGRFYIDCFVLLTFKIIKD